MITAYCITLRGNEVSTRAQQRLRDSAPTNVRLEIFSAVSPGKVSGTKFPGWNYPWEGEEFDFKSGLNKKAYPTQDKRARMACFLSHWHLWHKCLEEGPIIIHEHDACYYTDEELPLDKFAKSYYDIIGLNNPRGATRLAATYDRVVQESEGDIVRAPKIDSEVIPQGIAGNSSYYIEPTGAKKLIALCNEYGSWPNDAIMNRQLISTLGQTKKYYTYVQGTRSTTTL